MTRLKAVLFDLGGTLVKTAAIPEIYKRILGSFGVGVDTNQILEAHKANEKEIDVDNGQIELGNDFWGQWNLKILRSLGVESNAEFLAKRIDELWWEYADLQFYPDVIDTLIQLDTKRIKMGIVTNGLRKDYEQILQRLEAASYFDVIVGIDTCSKAKPDREIFLYAVEKLRLKPAEVLFVGDSAARDYYGAKGAGLKPLLIDREGKALQDVEAIKSLTEVLLYF